MISCLVSTLASPAGIGEIFEATRWSMSALGDPRDRLRRQQVRHDLKLGRLFLDDDAGNHAAVGQHELRVLKLLVDLARGIEDLLAAAFGPAAS